MIDDFDVLNDLDQIRSRYDVLRELGRDGACPVYAVRSRASGRHYLVKVMDDAASTSAKAGLLHVWQAHGMDRVDHPNLMVLHAVHHLQGGSVAVAMERRRGRTLAELIDDGGPLPAGDAERILRDVAAALAYLHGRGVVHRGVSPRSIFLDRDSGRVLLAHFAVDATYGGPSATPGATASVPQPYLAPEQVEGGRRVEGRHLSPRSDVYALGQVGHAMLAGRPPSPNDETGRGPGEGADGTRPPLRALRPEVPDHLIRAIEGCIRVNPRQRWSDGRELLAQLEPGGSVVNTVVRAEARPGSWREAMAKGVAAGRASLMDLGARSAAAFGAARANVRTARDDRAAGVDGIGAARRGFDREAVSVISPALEHRSEPATTTNRFARSMGDVASDAAPGSAPVREGSVRAAAEGTTIAEAGPSLTGVVAGRPRTGTTWIAADTTLSEPRPATIAANIGAPQDPVSASPMFAESARANTGDSGSTIGRFGPGLSTVAWLAAERAAHADRASEAVSRDADGAGRAFVTWLAARRAELANAGDQIAGRGRGAEDGVPEAAAADRSPGERFAARRSARGRIGLVRPTLAISAPPEAVAAIRPRVRSWRRRAPLTALLLAIVTAGVISRTGTPITRDLDLDGASGVASPARTPAVADEGAIPRSPRPRLAGAVASPPPSASVVGNPAPQAASPEPRRQARPSAPARRRSTGLVLLGEPAAREGYPVLLGDPVHFANFR